MNEYEKIIKEIITMDINSYELISDTSNIVYKVNASSEVLYVKFYKNNSSHIDHELSLYKYVNNKYLKELVYRNDEYMVAVFKELKGKTIDDLSIEELNQYSDSIIDSLCEFFYSVNSIQVEGYGILDINMNGKYLDFHEFICERQKETAFILKEYSDLNGIFDKIYSKYSDIIKGTNKLVPIDTNMKNIMILDNGDIKFIDPGELISGPILMGYGDFVAHTYKTILYNKLVSKLKLDDNDAKLIRIYAIFSSLNILAFLKKNGVSELDKVIPYGNTYSFYELIKEHLKYLDI